MTDRQGESSIAPLFQNGAIIIGIPVIPLLLFEPRHEKAAFLHMLKQKR